MIGGLHEIVTTVLVVIVIVFGAVVLFASKTREETTAPETVRVQVTLRRNRGGWTAMVRLRGRTHVYTSDEMAMTWTDLETSKSAPPWLVELLSKGAADQESST